MDHLFLKVLLFHCLPARGSCMCLQWAASGHGKSQDADLPYAVPGFHPLHCVHLQTSGSSWSVPGHQPGTDGQHSRELGPFHELRLLPAGHPLHSWTAQRCCAEV